MRRLLIAVAILTGIGGGAASHNGLTFVPAAHASEGDEIRQVLDRWVVAFPTFRPSCPSMRQTWWPMT